MAPDGKNVVELTSWPSNESIAIGAPGNKVAFTSDKSGNEDIFIMDENGNNAEVLIQTTGNEFYPLFSPVDFNLITFISDLDGQRKVYLFDLTSKEIKNFPGLVPSKPIMYRMASLKL